ncbi:hypothetical protein DMA11_18010 [Marinilabiliaceae bacterium JC017]|nr:hypothetical protein DMA11_18010 [Marinilabiliaceae bacterium JC017]
MKHQYRPILRIVAIYLVVNLLGSIFFPTIVYALTSGPKSPEFSGFTPVGSTDMVNTFTGDFNYNLPVIEVPGPHGSGYSLSLSYNSGNTSEQEASWVGFGWTLNPGCINRNLRGFPDEYNGEKIDYFNKSRPNWTATSSTSGGLEVFSKDLSVGLTAGSKHRINNYSGYQKVDKYGVNFNGCVGVNATKDANGVTYDSYISPIGIFSTIFKEKDKGETNITNSTPEKKKWIQKEVSYLKGKITEKAGVSTSVGDLHLNLGLNSFSISLVPPTPKPFNYPQYNGFSVNWSVSMQCNPAFAPVGIEAGKAGTFSYRFNEPKSTVPVYGYNNSPGSPGGEIMTDYYMEKNKPFNVSDYVIGIPHSNYDVFSVTGEGVMGGFRSFLPKLGHYTPKNSVSKTTHGQAGYEVMVGANCGAGLDLGVGFQKTNVEDWFLGYAPGDDVNISDNEIVYRFNNDKGGQVIYDDTEIKKAKLNVYGGDPGSLNGIYNGQGKFARNISGSSSYIKDVKKGDRLIGMEIVNKDGIQFYYDEPVMVRNETSLSIDIRKEHTVQNRFLAFADLKLSQENGVYTVKNTQKALKSPKHKTLLGQINPNTYASNFLLTKILGSSYIDADGDKQPSDADFGGWTKFGYQTVYGGGKDWYRYRMPYNGLLYQQNAISDIKDDLGSVETGEKEVKYLHTIETKTHIAYFITNNDIESENPYLRGSNKGRLDGIGAKSLTGSDDPAANINEKESPFGNTKLQYLEKIVLFAKQPEKPGAPYEHYGQKPLKTIRFEYDYSLVPNVANNENSNYNYIHEQNPVKEDNGKLTLRKVWVEYEGVVSAKISPYIFNYHYPKVKEESEMYRFYSDYNRLLSDDVQNPPYAPYALDAWGNNAPNGEQRRSNGIAWTDQSAFLDLNNDLEYDPAAYQLKSIQLPSGGTIYIQYEAKDYAFVQNRSAMAMARAALPPNQKSPSYGEDSYIVNVADLGVDPSEQHEVDKLVSKIKDHFKQDNKDEKKDKGADNSADEFGRKIYYKFLFSLLDDTPSLDNPQSEYITGYADFKGVKRICLNEQADEKDKKYGVEILLGGVGQDEKGGKASFTPRMACRDFVANHRQGKVASGDCVEPTFEREYDDVLSRAADKGGVEKLLKYTVAVEILVKMAIGIGVQQYGNFLKEDPRVGQRIHPELSFLKLPVLHKKMGGGARVKRILLHDTGIEDGDEVVLGTEYSYTMEDGITSSGVATNEPGLAREENPLVDFMPKKGLSLWKRLITGDNLEQTEGPIGEAILPAPCIGYRRVVMENIHKGKTGNGFSIDEYFTVYDYPFDKYYSRDVKDPNFDFTGAANQMTELDESSDDLKIMTGLFNYIVSKQWAIQGFRFIQTNMHGVPKCMVTYSGTYDDYLKDKNSTYLVTGQEYDYYEPGEKIKVIGFDENNALNTFDVFPGKEMDIVRESKKVIDTSLDFNVEVDISVGTLCFPPIFVGVMPSFSYTENTLATHATTKVISYPAVLKSTTNTVEGISSKSENIAFDVLTGDPVLVRNTDSYDGVVNCVNGEELSGQYFSFSVPAGWVYKEMGQKAEIERNTNQLNQKVATFLVREVEPDAQWLKKPHNLLSAVITKFGKKWADVIAENDKVINDYSVGADNGGRGNCLDHKVKSELNEKWLPAASYTYNGNLDAKEKVYEKGVYSIVNKQAAQNDPLIDWNANELNGNWIKTSEICKYSVNSEVIEERDVLGIPSAALYGRQYGNSVPSMVANNADYNSILFEDFETLEASSAMAHSGKNAAVAGTLKNLLPGIKITPVIKDQGGIVKFWLNGKLPGLTLKILNSALVPDDGTIPVTGENEQLPATDINLEMIASVDGWTLYQGVIDAANHLGSVEIVEGEPLMEVRAELHDANGEDLQSYLIDDIRFQPLNASSSCFVYDPENLRLMAQFDDQHFGTYFQYNQEGKLTRKMIETERGKHTLQEMHYNIPTVNR